ncbi:PREDICTED: uncharacterized protein LOC109116736 [Tarenaya hassleriana]|uniref:uncharacterized protein LOC109116736 n=1 Tax=Tarenaya hassleriana TaxID=28532 RepID=UPI0008FD3A48|nr:PREDICTED: uncharacterized protein LOC109116736 [Tarenaya hassleriana]
MSNVTKLTSTNYIMWNVQIRALLEGHNLEYFILDSNIIPAAMISCDDSLVANPAFEPFRQQDRLLFFALLGTISLPLQPMVARSRSVRDAWASLAKVYGKASRGHLLQLRDQIKRSTKGK